MATRLLVLVYLLVALCAVVGLWRFWTPRCNEACEPWIVMSMYGTFVLVPATAVGLATLTLRGKLGRNASLGTFAVIAIALALWVGFVTQATTGLPGR
jgi:uncharacterized membrane protein